MNHRGPPPLEGTSLHRWNNSVERPWGILSLFTTCLHAGVTVTWRLCKAGRFSYGESPRTPPLEGTSLHRWNNSVERPWGILSLFTTCLYAGVTVTWRLCKAGRFSYGESPRTPPLEGTSLHRWNNSVERPWGILSLFTTCLHAGVTVTWRLCKAGRFSYGESPRTPPLEGTSLHRETIVWRDPGGSWACLRPVCMPESQSRGVFVKQVVFLTVNHRGPLPLRELHSTDEIIVWRDPGGSWACLRPMNSQSQTPARESGVFVKQSFFFLLAVNHRGPLPLRELNSTGENNSVKRP